MGGGWDSIKTKTEQFMAKQKPPGAAAEGAVIGSEPPYGGGGAAAGEHLRADGRD